MNSNQPGSSRQLTLGGVPLTVDDRGTGRAILLLHGGAGPVSVARLADLLATTHGARVLTPTHPGFLGAPRPAELTTTRQLAQLYAALLDELALDDVTVVGSSIGGWIAAELGLLGSARVARVVLINACGIAVDGHPVADVFTLSLDELMQRSYHNPAAFRIDPSTMSDAQRAGMAANRAALACYGRPPEMADPTLRGRLADLARPTLVLWGEADRVVDATYGRAFADAIPGARFELLPQAGHLPQLETPDRVLREVWAFADAR